MLGWRTTTSVGRIRRWVGKPQPSGSTLSPTPTTPIRMRGVCCRCGCQPPWAPSASGCRQPSRSESRRHRPPRRTGRDQPNGAAAGGRRAGAGVREPGGGRQVWLGRRLAGQTVQVRLDGATMHVSLDGHLLKTLPCRLQPRDLGQGRLAGARPAGPAAASVAAHAVLGSGDGIEVTRRVNAGGTVGVAGRQVSVGLPLAGHTVTLRLEAATMHVLADGALVLSLPSPVQAAARAKLHGARLARGRLVVPQGPVVVHRVRAPAGRRHTARDHRNRHPAAHRRPGRRGRRGRRQ